MGLIRLVTKFAYFGQPALLTKKFHYDRDRVGILLQNSDELDINYDELEILDTRAPFTIQVPNSY